MSQPKYPSSTTHSSNYVFSPGGMSTPSSVEHSPQATSDPGQQLFDAVDNNPDFNCFCQQVANIIVDEIDCAGLWVIGADESGNFNRQQPLTPEAESALELVRDSLSRLANQAASERRLLVLETTAPTQHQLIASPVVIQNKVEFILCGFCSVAKQTAVRQRWLLSMATQAVNLWMQRHQLNRQSDFSSRLNAWLQLSLSLARCQSLKEAYLSVVNQLRLMYSASQVSLCIQDREAFPLVAVSDVEQLDAQTEINREIQVACSQAERTGESVWFDGGSKKLNQSTLPLYQYSERHGWATCCSVPLSNSEQETVATVLLAWKKPPQDDRAKMEIDSRLATLIADQLSQIERGNRNVVSRSRAFAKKTVSSKWMQLVGVGVLIFSLAMCIPMPYRIPCKVQLQPVKRRYVAAPYDGILDRTLVEHGEIVERDQVLAQMDGHKLQMELAGLEAEYSGARKRSESARAVGEIAQSQIAASEMKRVAAEIKKLTHRLDNLEIKSPIDGIVVGGDLEKAEGAPLELGQMLFEIGPLEKMLAEVRIPEHEILYAQPGMEVQLKFDAIPFETFTGTVARIRPRAEILEDENVFVAEVELDNSNGQLRPGLNGSAKIKSKSHLLGWNLFHNGWESARHWLIW